ncbi:MAG: valine--tRNA ligase [Bacillales bacterium]|nr:valine--tRNA ligase [Bacillales bacterium]MDY6003172.1 valine--tRNA ligase [Bacilli bacterium]
MLEKRYDPHKVEEGKYDNWKSKGYFTAGEDLTKTPFTMVIPPPNVTGKLHLGHAWNTTVQDITARYKKMKGYDVLWLPGMDHAGIATQAKVEEKLRKEGITRYDLGREKFLEKAWEWKYEYADNIHKQWAKMGLALDYTRERFTLDDGMQKAVKRVFKNLYDKGLIYRGERIINYDPELRTALSNIEVVYENEKGKFYYFKYPIVGSDEYLIVATTRPETMFGDVAVFVNPEDPRYKHLIGKKVINPANDEQLPIMGDDYVDIEFGTGAMKCTPAHDPNDFALSEKYHLEKIKCMNVDATMNDICGKYVGMDRYECRDALVNDIDKKGLLLKIEEIEHQVGHSERSGTVVEPFLSKQWFVKMRPLAEQALNKSTVNFVPKRFDNTFRQWMENVDDWCISRQLWWGHRIPAYYNDSGDVIVSEEDINLEGYHQDEDVLDTWFSSALWPFATLGWPNNTDDLKRYFPNNLLVTAYDIIFFWVSRMIFDSLEFTKESPFKDCLIHGLIRDSKGRKMSKSLGNGIDPIDVIDKYGVDALRYFLTTGSAPGQDIRYMEEKVIASSNYLNKIWNSARYVLENLGSDFEYVNYQISDLKPVERDIIIRMNKTIKEVGNAMDKYEYSLASTYLYNFVYDDFCSNYLEMSKVSLNINDEQYKKIIKSVLVDVLKNIILMIYPYAPFISEELYLNLPSHLESIMLESYPQYEEINIEFNQVELLYKIITDIRNYKVNAKLAPNYKIKLVIETKLDLFEGFNDYLSRFSFASDIKKVVNSDSKGTKFVYDNLNVYIEDNITEEEKNAKKAKDIAYLEAEIKRCEGLLNNPNFVNKAPESKVKLEQEKLAKYKEQLANLK